jgi:hypothetical protein
VRSIVIPIFDVIVIDPVMPDQPPNADQVAAILFEAASEMGTSPYAIASGKSGNWGHWEIPRARAYAALVMRALFPENGSMTYGRLCGSRSPKSWLTKIDNDLRNGKLQWWSDQTFMKILNAAERRIGAMQ